MKIKSTSEIEIPEILEHLIKDADSQGIKSEPANFKVMVQNKSGEFVELAHEKVKIVFCKE